ncbi:uncharacterized protein LOC129308362 [Prosopis cineraria]|uniref:uncharacterized protein LOC129308362 n=1 Tax=Prosopis cineraria TaxID=364024 RepID=UPI00240EAE86|nr:uncharacterized protein LOC129308362 [Prosopis cineraria]
MSSETTECFFEINTGDGWEKSLTKILSSFEDPVFDINPTLGYAYVKGKTDRYQILKKLKKGGKHADLKRITFGSQGDDNNHNNPPHASSLPKMGPLYDPYYHYADDLYNYHSRGYNPWHANNNLSHLFLNNPRNYHGPNHHLPHPLHGHGHEWRGSFHRHDSHVTSSSTSSSSSRPVTGPKPSTRPPVTEPVRLAPSRRLGFIKKVFFIKKGISIKKITRKFRSCLRFCDKIK